LPFNGSGPLAKVRRLLEQSKVSESEIIDVLRAAEIAEAKTATSLSEIPDKTLHLAISSWDTVVALSEELRSRGAEAV
jgi:hypothetical protein